MNLKLLYKRYKVALILLIGYVLIALLVRIILSTLVADKIQLSLIKAIKIWGNGFLFDLAVALAFIAIYILFITFFPTKWIGKK